MLKVFRCAFLQNLSSGSLDNLIFKMPSSVDFYRNRFRCNSHQVISTPNSLTTHVPFNAHCTISNKLKSLVLLIEQQLIQLGFCASRWFICFLSVATWAHFVHFNLCGWYNLNCVFLSSHQFTAPQHSSTRFCSQGPKVFTLFSHCWSFMCWWWPFDNLA